MELKDFVGLHRLSGVDMNSEIVKQEWGESFEDCQVINFVIDRKTYTATEDPEDGYRSSMREIKQSKAVVKNIFPPVPVMGIMRGKNGSEDNDIIDFYDTKSGLVVLSIGTGNTDDYYPYFVAEFSPQNMAVNQGK